MKLLLHHRVLPPLNRTAILLTTNVPVLPSDLSTILEESEFGTHPSREQFTQHRKQFKDQASISSASDIIHEITESTSGPGLVKRKLLVPNG